MCSRYDKYFIRKPVHSTRWRFHNVQRIRKWVETFRTLVKNTNLIFNCKKTKSVLFSTRKMSQHHQPYNNAILKINFNNQTIERMQQCKFRGVVIDESFELYTHVRNIFKNGYSTLEILKKLKRYTSYQIRKHLVESLKNWLL